MLLTDEQLNKTVFFLEKEMPGPEMYRLAGGVAAVYSMRGPNKEDPNEDAAALIPLNGNAAVLVVADGVGGVRAGELAAEIAVRSLSASLRQNGRDNPELRIAILDGIEKANQSILEQGLGAATTLAVVEIQGNQIRPYHIGDSSILVFGQRGKLKLQTVPHSPVGFAIESGLMNEEEAMHHEARHIVSNVIGMDHMRIEVGAPFTLSPYDTVLIASDGLYDNLHTDEIVSRLRKGPMKQAAGRLASDSRQRMLEPNDHDPSKPDDLTFVTFRCGAPKAHQ
jgi:serine/threonine protein phosphatase PrpC